MKINKILERKPTVTVVVIKDRPLSGKNVNSKVESSLKKCIKGHLLNRSCNCFFYLEMFFLCTKFTKDNFRIQYKYKFTQTSTGRWFNKQLTLRYYRISLTFFWTNPDK